MHSDGNLFRYFEDYMHSDGLHFFCGIDLLDLGHVVIQYFIH